MTARRLLFTLGLLASTVGCGLVVGIGDFPYPDAADESDSGEPADAMDGGDGGADSTSPPVDAPGPEAGDAPATDAADSTIADVAVDTSAVDDSTVDDSAVDGAASDALADTSATDASTDGPEDADATLDAGDVGVDATLDSALPLDGGGDATLDTGAPGDGGGDASDGSADAPDDVREAGADAADAADAGCTLTWCGCVAPSADFCDDFDQPGEVLGGGEGAPWSAVVMADGGTLAIVAGGSSLPNALHAVEPYSGFSNTPEVLSWQAQSVSVRVAFDMKVPLNQCEGSQPQPASLIAQATFGSGGGNYVAFATLNDQPALVIFASFITGTQYYPIADSGLLSGQWVRVHLDAKYVAATNSVSGAVATLPAGSADDADAGILAMQTLVTTTGGSPPVVSVGATEQGNGTAACKVFIDNVAIYSE